MSEFRSGSGVLAADYCGAIVNSMTSEVLGALARQCWSLQVTHRPSSASVVNVERELAAYSTSIEAILFLFGREDTVAALAAAAQAIDRYFVGAVKRLSVEQDPEEPDYDILVLTIYSSLPPTERVKAMLKLQEKWWIDQPALARAPDVSLSVRKL